MSRPEDLLPPDLFYNDRESRKYTSSSRIRQIQAQMTNRALELLNLQSPSFILDAGCGSGLSGEILAKAGHTWVGMDISPSMLDVAVQRREGRQTQSNSTNGHDEDMNQNNDDDDDNEEQNGEYDSVDEDEDEDEDDSEESREPLINRTIIDGGEGDLFLHDMAQGLPFRPGTFDAAISISAVQWLCNIESTSSQHQTAESRLRRFFDTLYISLKRGGKAVIQFYPKNESQRNMITQAAIRAGFGAGLLEDDGGTKNEKLFLVLSVGGGDISGVVDGWEGVDVEDGRSIRDARVKVKGRDGLMKKGGKAWVLGKKEKMRAKGKVVKGDSKYTGRKRRIKF